MTVTLAATASTAVARGAMVPIGSGSAVNGGIISFTSIPSSYKDLMCVVSAVGSANYTGTNIWPRINADTGSNYSYTALKGDGTSLTSYRGSNGGSFWPLDSAFGNNITGGLTIHLLNYADTSRLKHGLLRLSGDANGSGSSQTMALTWNSTAAISEITLFIAGGNSQAAHCNATLYGIRGIA